MKGAREAGVTNVLYDIEDSCFHPAYTASLIGQKVIYFKALYKYLYDHIERLFYALLLVL